VGYREVKAFGSEFPTHDQILSGDLGSPPWPKEVWLQQTQPGEFAVRYEDFKTGSPRSPKESTSNRPRYAEFSTVWPKHGLIRARWLRNTGS